MLWDFKLQFLRLTYVYEGNEITFELSLIYFCTISIVPLHSNTTFWKPAVFVFKRTEN
jgi:hypothetical protein